MWEANGWICLLYRFFMNVPFRNVTLKARKRDCPVLGTDICFSESGLYGWISFSVFCFLVSEMLRDWEWE